MRASPDIFAHLTHLLMNLAGGKLCAVLEVWPHTEYQHMHIKRFHVLTNTCFPGDDIICLVVCPINQVSNLLIHVLLVHIYVTLHSQGEVLHIATILLEGKCCCEMFIMCFVPGRIQLDFPPPVCVSNCSNFARRSCASTCKPRWSLCKVGLVVS